MALTGTETFGTVVPGFVTNLAGSLAVTSVTAGTGYGIVPGFITDADGRLLVSTDTTGAAWVGGFIRNSNGALVITSSAPTDFGTIVPGFNTNSSGHLAMSSATGAAWVTGFLQNTNKSLALAGYGAYVNLLSPSILLSLAGSTPLTDLSGNARNGTAAGGVTGGASPLGPITGAPTPRRNLCKNPSLETDSTRWSQSYGGVARSIEQAYDGTASLKNTATAANAQAYYDSTVADGFIVVGSSYTWSAYARPVQSGRNIRAQINWYVGNTYLSSSVGTTSTSVATGQWTRFEVTATAPATANRALCYIQHDLGLAGTAGDVTYIDGGLLELSSEAAGTYFPTTAQLASGEAGWYGTANASDSYSIGTPYVPNDTGATDFDGTDDRITTTYGTRRQFIQDPQFQNGTTWWKASTAAFGSGTMNYAANTDEQGLGYASITGVHDGTSSNHQTQFDSFPYGPSPVGAAPVSPGESVRVKVDLRPTAGTNRSSVDGVYLIYVIFFNSSGGYISAFPVPTITSYTLGEWATYQSAVGVAPALAAYMKISIRWKSSLANEAYSYDVRRPILEKTSGTVGTYFDGSGYIDESGNWISDPGGHVGWLGTAHASASDKGCFANGTTRTFMGWAYRDASANADAIFGSNVSPSMMFRFNSGADTVSLYASSATGSVAWACPSPGVWFHWALIFDESANNASLYVNGALVSTQTLATQWVASATLRYGSRAGTADPFNGKMAWVSVHERALTADEILAAYQAR